MLQVSYSRDWHFFEFGFFMVLGVFGGLSGALLIRASLVFQQWKSKGVLGSGLVAVVSRWVRNLWPVNPVSQVLVVAWITSLLSYINPFTRSDSSELLEYLFRECSEANYMGICGYF